VMVWGGFSARGRTPLYRVKDSMQSDQYEEVIGDLLYHHIVADFGSPGGAWLPRRSWALSSSRGWVRAQT